MEGGKQLDSFAGAYQSAAIGFGYAPMDRDCIFAEDGSAWISVAFVGPEMEFKWQQPDADHIQVWTAEEPGQRQMLEIARNGREILLSRPEEELDRVLEGSMVQLVSALEFEPLVRVK